jgi:hypothetical protein
MSDEKINEAQKYLSGLLTALAQKNGSLSFSIDFGREEESREELDKEVEAALSDHMQLESGLREAMGVPADIVGVDNLLKYIEGRVMQIQGDRNEANTLLGIVQELLEAVGLRKEGEELSFEDAIVRLRAYARTI